MIDFEELSKNEKECVALLETDPRAFIEAYLEHAGNDVDDMKYGDKQVNGVDIKNVYEEGDTEGGGSHSEVVFEILLNRRPTGVFFRRVGYYTSHHGTDWNDSFSLVEPHQITVVRYVDK